MHGGGNFHHRIRRGFVIPPMWFGPQFHVNNWQMYGFAAPSADQRWVRYYDDAYLIDRGGRVIDSREGMDWDRYGEEWDMADGIPAYRGSRDYAPDDEDYAWGAENRGHGGHGGHGGGYGPPMAGAGYGYAGGHAYGGGYGYGYYAYPIVIETITTSGGATITEEVTETVYEVRRRARPRRARCVCAPRRSSIGRRPARRRGRGRSAVRPPGERGYYEDRPAAKAATCSARRRGTVDRAFFQADRELSSASPDPRR